MKSSTRFAAGMAVVPLTLLGIGVAIASSVVTPNTFVGGTTAVAAEVNANFVAHAAAINDNDLRIDQHEARLGDVSRIELEENNASVNFLDLETGVKEVDSVTIDAPTAGNVLVISTGHCLFFEDDRTIFMGVSDQNTTLGLTSEGTVSLGRVDGAATERYYQPYTTMRVFPVAAGTHTFYTLARATSNVSGEARPFVASTVALFQATP